METEAMSQRVWPQRHHRAVEEGAPFELQRFLACANYRVAQNKLSKQTRAVTRGA
jgi:hypothetical protein